MSKADLPYGYILFVDEAGDDGLRRVKPMHPNGASEWLCISGVLVREKYENDVVSWVKDIRSDINSVQGPSLHFRKLSPHKKAGVCARLSKLPAQTMVVCSHKVNMQGHQNERAASRGGKQWFYNYCVRLLLERATKLCERDSNRHFDGNLLPIKVIFSARGGHSYGQTKAYLEVLKAQALGNSTYLQKRQINHRALRFDLIEYVPHNQMAGLGNPPIFNGCQL